MSDTRGRARRLSRIRDRGELLDRERAIAAATNEVDVVQRRLAQQFLELRRELVALHDILWPPEPGRTHRAWRRPGLPGPPPIPPTLPDAAPVSGRLLRRAAAVALAKARTPLTLAEIHRALHLAGYRLTGTNPVKQLADALGYEERRGRVRRVARGTYELGQLSPARRRRAAG
jgi:hypothetical protein